MTKESHLHQIHQKSGAKFMPFADWSLPAHYAGQIHEHRVLRQNAGVFDLSHLCMVDLLGAGCRSLLRLLLSKDVDNLKVNQGFHALMLNHHGGIISDVTVFHQSPECFHLIFSQFNYEEVMKWLSRQCKGLSVGVQERTDLALISMDGPKALKSISHFLPNEIRSIVSENPLSMIHYENWFASRTDFVGEAGITLGFPIEQAQDMWQKWLDSDLQPCGLGAWLAARIESGICTYGIDITKSDTPYECGLDSRIDWEPNLREFIGKGALETLRRSNPKRKLVGIVLEEDGMLQHGQVIRIQDIGEGVVTSGTFSPLFEHAIGLGFVPYASEDSCEICIRDKWFKAQLVPLPFAKEKPDLTGG